jgi:tagatose 6-phosphate kinase
VITRGREGAIVCSEEDLWTIIPPKVEVINSVGSGDAFVGGCAVAIAKGQSILDAVKLGTAAGAANAEKLTAGDITYERVQELLNEIEWHRL